MRVEQLSKPLAACGAAAALALGWSGPALASTSSIDAASIPFALAYGACIYAEPATGTATGQPDCTSAREALLAEANPVLERFYLGHSLEAKRSLRFLFEDMDEQAIELSRENKAVGPEVIAFMRCVSQDMRSSADFRRGAFVSGSDAFTQCRDIYDDYLERDRSSSAVQRNVNYLRYIKRILPMAGSAPTINKDGLLIERGPRD